MLHKFILFRRAVKQSTTGAKFELFLRMKIVKWIEEDKQAGQFGRRPSASALCHRPVS